MKKIAITCALLTSFATSSVWADAAGDLKNRLDKVSSFPRHLYAESNRWQRRCGAGRTGGFMGETPEPV